MAVGTELFQAKIFISHTHQDRLGQLLAPCLAGALRERGLVPFLDDNDLQPSDQWRERLGQNLAGCAGAVVLFTRDALTASSWVKQEALVLLNRWVVARQAFPLFFVLLDDVEVALRDSPDDWQQLLGPINFIARKEPANADLPEAGDPASKGEPPAAVVQQIEGLAGEIADKMRPQCVALADHVQVPGDRLFVGELVNVLRKVPGSALRIMDEQLDALKVDEALHLHLGYELVRAVRRFPDELADAVGTQAAAKRLYQLGATALDAPTVIAILSRLEYFLADPKAVSQLNTCFYAPAGTPSLARLAPSLRLKDQRVVHLYVHRAHMRPSRPLVTPIAITNSGIPSELVESVKASLGTCRKKAEADKGSTVVIYFSGPLHEDTRKELEAACEGYPSSVVCVVYGAASSDDDVIHTVYDEQSRQEALSLHRCSAYEILSGEWPEVKCCPAPPGAKGGS